MMKASLPAPLGGAPAGPGPAEAGAASGSASTTRAGALAGRPRLSWADIRAEPFRIFFPIAVLAALVGVMLWPLMLAGWMEAYPGLRHARLMIFGFFGAFILGFTGTAMPRLLETPPLWLPGVLLQAVLHCLAVMVYTLGSIPLGDALFGAELVVWVALLGSRLAARRDLPPPGFVLMPLAVAAAVAGLLLDWHGRWHELPPSADVLMRLLAYHAFILLSVLGAGSFLLPRFLGLGPPPEFPVQRTPSPAWRKAAWQAGFVGVILVGSYVLEAMASPRLGVTVRVAAVMYFLSSSMPLRRVRWSWRGVHWLLVTGLVCIPLGILAGGFWPGWRVGLSHIELVTGFGLITFAVGTRVVFGHSGQGARLQRVHPWLTTATILMILGMLSRLSGEVLPSTMVRHYIYGAVCWGAGGVIWLVCVWRGLVTPDPDR